MSPVLLRIASRSVWKNWRHSLGAALAVAVGFTAIALFNGYLSDFERMLTRLMEERYMQGTLVVAGEGATQALTRGSSEGVFLGEPEQAFIEAYLREHAAEVVTRVRTLFVAGLASNGSSSTQFIGWGYDPAEGAAIRRRYAWDTWYGKPLHQAGPEAALPARGLASLLECAPATKESPFGPDGNLLPKDRPFSCKRQRIQLISRSATGQVNAIAVTVAGMVDGGRDAIDASALMMPLAQAQKLRDSPEISQVNVLLRDPSKAESFARDLVTKGRARGLALEAIPWLQSWHGETARQGMGILRTFRSLMAVVVVALAGMAIFTTMAKAVNERTREVGTLRSLGFLRGQVTRLFALEAALLSACACAVGLLLTLGFTALINGAGVSYRAGMMATPIPLGVAADPASYLRIAAFLVAVAVFAAWLPARRAARRKIPDALAYA